MKWRKVCYWVSGLSTLVNLKYLCGYCLCRILSFHISIYVSGSLPESANTTVYHNCKSSRKPVSQLFFSIMILSVLRSVLVNYFMKYLSVWNILLSTHNYKIWIGSGEENPRTVLTFQSHHGMMGLVTVTCQLMLTQLKYVITYSSFYLYSYTIRSLSCYLEWQICQNPLQENCFNHLNTGNCFIKFFSFQLPLIIYLFFILYLHFMLTLCHADFYESLKMSQGHVL